MKIAMTGISGYLGHLVLSRLVAHPQVESILGLDLNPPRLSSPKLKFEKADVCSADFERLLQGCDVLYHLAFIVQPPRGFSMDKIDFINIEGSKRVFSGAAKAGVPKIIYSSSVAAYGAHEDNPVGLTEDHPLRPNSDWYYSRAKGQVESYLNEFQAAHPQVTLIRFRPCTFLGPTVDNTLADRFKHFLILTFSENYIMDFCWDEDVADAFVLALNYPRSNIFNLVGDKPINDEKIAALLGKRLIRLSPVWLAPLAKVAAKVWIVGTGMADWALAAQHGLILVSNARAKKELNWKPRYDQQGAIVAFARSVGILK